MNAKQIEAVVAEVNEQLEGTAVKPITRKRGAAKAEAKPAAAKRSRKQAEPKAEPVVNTQDSVTGTFKLARMPKGNGGVRFEVENDRPFSPVYIAQDDFEAMGRPERIRATYKAL